MSLQISSGVGSGGALPSIPPTGFASVHAAAGRSIGSNPRGATTGDRRRQLYPTAACTALIERCREVLARLHRDTDGRQTPPSAVLSTSDPKKLSRKVVLRQRPLIAEGSWAAPLRRWWTSHRAAASAALKMVIHASFGRPPQALFRDAERSNTLARRRALTGRTE
jgi:hypothetical protein